MFVTLQGYKHRLIIRICCLPFDVLSVICRLHNLWSPFKIPFYLVPPIVFSSRAHAINYLGTIRRFSWNGTEVSRWRFHDNRHMNTSADVSKFKIVLVHVKCWILLKPVLGGVDGSLHFTVPSMNRLNQTEPATFSMMLCWTFFRDSYFLFFNLWVTLYERNILPLTPHYVTLLRNKQSPQP
jgi:hypothetical protein